MKSAYYILMVFVACTAVLASDEEEEEEIERWPVRQRTAVDILGSAENVDLVLHATHVSVEHVSLPKHVEVLGWKNGVVQTEEVEALGWDQKTPLLTTKGPVSVPVAMLADLRSALTRTYTYRVGRGAAIACGYVPTHRFTFSRGDQRLEVLLIRKIWSLDVFSDGKRVGGRSNNREVWRVKTGLEKLFIDW
ncbi:MAG: hypothetical protein JNN01_24720 [Opitutaceae bacterium]|nr:hypothetical protein [Opitutaceae bacterium]